MKNGITRFSFLLFFLTIAQIAAAQTSDGSANNYFLISMVVIAVLILIVVIVQVADNLLRIEAREAGADDGKTNYSIFPGVNEIFRSKMPAYVNGDPVTILKKGHDILLEGEAEGDIDTETPVSHYAIQPPNFIGISPIPKVVPEIGTEVKAGDVLFFDKKRPDIKYTAPVSGEFIALNRGEKRSVAELVILADKEIKYREFEAFDLESESREALTAYMMEAGVWPMIRQRPYDVVADPNDVPKSIFISTFSTAPLAPDMNVAVKGREAAFQKGLDVLAKLTSGKVHLGLNARGEQAPSKAFIEAQGVAKHWFHGPHPAGNVGIHIHHIDPINASDKVWVLGVQEVLTIGTLFLELRYDASRIVALTGSELKQAKYVHTYLGASIEGLLKDNLSNEQARVVSGDVLSGQSKEKDSFLNYYDNQITVLEEGDFYELFGWLLPIAPRPTISNTFPNFLYPDLKFKANTNTHGEKRAFVVTGQYESVLPMDIYPQHLMKSILINDFERMEGLGIYELSEEDVALCEFVCTSKQPLQQILRKGLDFMREQG
ncbi:MAG: Na(+)-translocating NADH-quinone reductase subunit A [Bacteroidota bacterium]